MAADGVRYVACSTSLGDHSDLHQALSSLPFRASAEHAVEAVVARRCFRGGKMGAALWLQARSGHCDSGAPSNALVIDPPRVRALAPLRYIRLFGRQRLGVISVVGHEWGAVTSNAMPR